MAGFVKVANEVFTRLERPIHIYIACRLYQLADMHRWGPFECSDGYLMERGPSKRDVRKVVKSLISLGLLVVLKPGDRNHSRLIQIANPAPKKADHEVNHEVDHGNDGKTEVFEESVPEHEPHVGLKYQTTDKTTDQNDADGAALPLPIARKLAASNLPTSADELARFPRSTIASADGIGAKSIATIAAWLAGHGVQFRPEPPKAAKRDSKPYTDAWKAAWTAKRSDAYPWDWFRESALLLQVAGVLGNDAARVEAAARAYLAAEASSGVWPHDEPSSVAKFRKTLDKWKTGKAKPARPVRDEMPASAIAKLELMRRLRAERGGE